jgi:hypothetical protein
MSWTVWCFDATWQTTLLMNIQTYSPSPSGEYFRSGMLELNYPGATLPTQQPAATGRPGNLGAGQAGDCLVH